MSAILSFGRKGLMTVNLGKFSGLFFSTNYTVQESSKWDSDRAGKGVGLATVSTNSNPIHGPEHLTQVHIDFCRYLSGTWPSRSIRPSEAEPQIRKRMFPYPEQTSETFPLQECTVNSCGVAVLAGRRQIIVLSRYKLILFQPVSTCIFSLFCSPFSSLNMMSSPVFLLLYYI